MRIPNKLSLFPHDEAVSRLVWPNGDIQPNIDGVELPSTATELLRGIFEEGMNDFEEGMNDDN